MARIRSIHPGFFTDDGVMQASLAARWLLLGIWSECDDQGAFQWRPATLKARIMPNDHVDVAALLDELAALKFLMSYEHQGAKFGLVRNFCKFQRPKKPNAVHVVPNQFRNFVGLSAASSEPEVVKAGSSSEPDTPSRAPSSEPVRNQFPTSSPPVPNQYGKVSAEVGGRMEDGGGSSSARGKNDDRQKPAKTDLERLAGILKLDHQAFHKHPKFAKFPAYMAEWIEAGCDPTLDVWPTIERLARRNPNITSPAFFDTAIREAHGIRIASQPLDLELWRKRIRALTKRNTWPEQEWGPRPGAPGCKVPKQILDEFTQQQAEKAE